MLYETDRETRQVKKEGIPEAMNERGREIAIDYRR
jgi:hypothetical protein